MSAESPAAPKRFHWVEGRYRRDDASVFTRRSYLPLESQCPDTAEDDTGRPGRLIEGSCVEVNKECFIATAAFGSELDSRVELLRKFRDDILLQTELREPFSKVLGAYYRYSPPIALGMKRHRAAMILLRWMVAYPAVLFARGFVALLRRTHREWSE
ncbi:MAG: hypothetical protein JRN25_03820 [Nitrososphaerota archaeon]|jgi:hypothetical protein|nr:hypothetical protein [Nitrososphaerota archaeon]MDG6980603.1 hypothetical protein [Nitrososphaerota archaeon]